MDTPAKNRFGMILTVLVATALWPALVEAQALTPTGAPRVHMTPWYEVDPHWPERPAGIEWADMPGVAVDGKDQVWICTRAKPHVQLYSPQGKLLRSWDHELLDSVHYLRLDPTGNLWVADGKSHVVLQFTPEGRLLRCLGTPGEPGCDEKHFDRPTDMAVTPAGDVFVTDGYGNTRVAHFDSNGRFVKAWGKPGVGPGEFSLPHSIVVDSKGILYVSDRDNVRVQVFDQSGEFLAEWRNLLVPWGLWVSKDDEIWIAGSSPMPWRPDDINLGCPPKDQVFMKFDTSGKLQQLWTIPKGEDGKEKPGELNWVHGLALDSQGNIYAGDIKGRRVQKFVRQR